MIIKPDRKLVSKLNMILLLIGVGTFLSIALFGALIALDDGGKPLLVIAITGGLELLWLIPGLLLVNPYYRSISYEIREDEVIARLGIITKSVKHVPFRTVTNLEIKRDPFDRLLGIGALHIQTAGMSGQTGAEEVLAGLVEVDGIYEQVATRIRQYRGAMTPDAAGNEPLPAGDDAVLAAILSEVRGIRESLGSG